jgi:hypothetical protein
MSGNSNDGLFAQGPSTVLLGRSVITSNGAYGVENDTSSNALYSYGDNRITGNGTADISGGLNTADKPQYEQRPCRSWRTSVAAAFSSRPAGQAEFGRRVVVIARSEATPQSCNRTGDWIASLRSR